MAPTAQEEFWQSNFGKEYTDRCEYSTPAALDAFYLHQFGVTRSAMNEEFLGDLAIGPILEVGCNTGNQLNLLQSQGYKTLYGLELQPYAVEKAKQLTHNINIIQGSAFDLPFRDNYFDLVFTAGVLIHISPEDLPRIMMEIYRVSKRYIWGMEYFEEQHTAINYRGNSDRLWKGNFSQKYRELFPDLSLVKEKKYKYLDNDNRDAMFLLKKVGSV